MQTIQLITPSGTKSEITCGEGALQRKLCELTSTRECFLLTDSNVYALYREMIEREWKGVPLFVLKAGEKSKNFDSLQNILERMIGAGLHRNACLIALGGGVIGDIGGLAASLYMRGIHCVQIPTTLLAQVDSSVGGKTAVDFGMVKNVIGAFYQPEYVIADPLFFATLPEREVRCGLGEIVKYGGLNGEIFDDLWQNKERLFDFEYLISIVGKCIAHKARVVEADEKEQGLRKSLNMGHTTGHALELFYGDKSHGEFVLIGMYLEILLAEEKGMCDREYVEKLKELIFLALGKLPDLSRMGDAAYLAKMDKKNRSGDVISMIVPTRYNEYAELNVPYAEYESFLRKKEKELC